MVGRVSWVLVGVTWIAASATVWGQAPATSPASGPHVVAPMTGSRVTSRRPTVHWSGGDGTVDFCRDHACSQVIATVPGHGGSAQPTADLDAGRVFFRVHAGGGTSAVEWFTVSARTTPVDSSWGVAFDANGDGFSDVIAPGADAVAIYAGGANGAAAQPMTTIQAPREAAGFGFSAMSAGDVNGDGYSDLVVGTFGTDRAYVYLGGARGLATTPAVTLRGPAQSMFGFGVAGAGDVNGDGYGDVLVGAPNGGRAFLYTGSASGLRDQPAVTLTAPAGSNHFGYAVASAGDVNGDGRADIVVGALSNEGFVYLGAAEGLANTPSTHLQTAAADFASTLSTAGDVNGDGYADVLVGAMGAHAFYVFNGSAQGVVTAHPTPLYGPANSWAGFSVSSGDFNNDGFSDALIATGGADVLVFNGSATGIPANATATTLTIRQGGEYSLVVRELSDVNGDGFSDAIVSTRATNTTSVYLGATGGLSTTAASTLAGPAPSAQPLPAGPATPLDTERNEQ